MNLSLAICEAATYFNIIANDGLHHIFFPASALTVSRTVLQNLTRAESFLRLKREAKKQTNVPGNSSLLINLLFLRLEKVLSSFFGIKSLLFLKSINKITLTTRYRCC